MPKWKKDETEFPVTVSHHETRGYQAYIPKPIMDLLNNPNAIKFVVAKGNKVEVKLTSEMLTIDVPPWWLIGIEIVIGIIFGVKWREITGIVAWALSAAGLIGVAFLAWSNPNSFTDINTIGDRITPLVFLLVSVSIHVGIIGGFGRAVDEILHRSRN